MPGKCLRDVALGQLAGCEMGLTLESEEGEVPHLRWSQAPPLPWPRPGSADSHVIPMLFPHFWNPQKNGDTGVFPMAQVVCGQFLDAAVIGVVFAQ